MQALRQRLSKAEAALHQTTRDSQATMTELSVEVEQLKEALSRREARSTTSQASQREKTTEIARLKAALARRERELQGRTEERAADMQALRAQVVALKGQLNETSRARDKAQATLGNKSRALTDAAQAEQDLQQEIATRDKVITELQREVGKTRFLFAAQKNLSSQEQQNLRSLKGHINELEAKISRLQGTKVAGAKADLKTSKMALAALKTERDAATANLQKLEDARQQDRTRLTQLEAELGSNQRTLQETKAQLAKRERALNDMIAARAASKAEQAEQRRTAGEVARIETVSKGLKAELAKKEAELSRLHDELRTVHDARQTERIALEETKAALVASMAKARATVQEHRATAKVTAKAPAAISRVRDLRFEDSGQTAQVELMLDGEATYRVREGRDGKKVLVVSGATLPRKNERVMDVSAYRGAVRSVASFNDRETPNQVRVVVDTKKGTQDRIRRDGNRLVWTFRKPAIDRVRAHFPTTVAAAAATAPSAGAGGLALPGGNQDYSAVGIMNPYPYKKRKKYRGKRINLTIKDAEIQDVLSFLAREGGVNIVATDDVKGSVSFHLENIPWDLALDMILKAKGLDYIKESGVYRVAPLETLQKEYDILLEKKKKMAALKSVVVRLITVNYASGEELAKRIKNLLSEKGSVDVDARTNTLIVKDIEEHVIAIEDLVRRLDTQTPQVLIEARIVEASSTFTRDVGVQWGGHLGFGQSYGNQTGLIFPNVIGLGGGSDDPNSPTGGVSSANPGFAVNLPAATGAGSGGALGLTLGSVGGAANLNLRLSAAEEEGSVKIVSAPKISTLDNTPASIQQGVSIPISVVSAQGVNTQFFNALLKLEVTPHVTQDANISLKIDITKNEPDFGQTGANGNPTIRKKEAHTELLVKDGDTTVIGGIYTRNASDGYKKVPFFADLPILGPLFRSHVSSDQRSELLIFITPRIINRQASEVRTE